jgi:hypothetical protein
MSSEPVPLVGILDAIKVWVQTVEDHKPDHSRLASEKLKVFGKFLAEDREFHSIFHQNLNGCSNDSPEAALECVYAFFNAVADTTSPAVSAATGRGLSKEHRSGFRSLRRVRPVVDFSLVRVGAGAICIRERESAHEAVREQQTCDPSLDSASRSDMLGV